jgi:hypothetical protein
MAHRLIEVNFVCALEEPAADAFAVPELTRTAAIKLNK